MKVAILGSGLIGTDLLVKIMRSHYLECSLFIGRNAQSNGMSKALNLGVPISDRSIQAIVDNPGVCDLVFDATSALHHKVHAPILEKLGKIAVDLTPAQVGKMCVPGVNLPECLALNNVNMVTCGGQASIPLAYVVGQLHDIDYIEVVSTIASRSAGPATRANIDEYVETTEKGLKLFSRARQTKVMLICNPAQPCINMQTTVCVKVQKPNLEQLRREIDQMVAKIQTYVPGYKLEVPPIVENERIMMMVRVTGLGDYLPTYAGNLDIINCAALATAEEYARKKLLGEESR